MEKSVKKRKKMLQYVSLLGTAYYVVNHYMDGGLLRRIQSHKKYIQLFCMALFGIAVYVVMSYYPMYMSTLLQHSRDYAQPELQPLLQYTERVNRFAMGQRPPKANRYGIVPEKRRVSETKKKYVAFIQGYKCYRCQAMLDHTYEVDHDVPLYKGGSNAIFGSDGGEPQLRALCRNCHGLKTASDRMEGGGI